MHKAEIIAALGDDELKYKYYKANRAFFTEANRTEIIRSFESDKYKEELLNNVFLPSSKGKIISAYRDLKLFKERFDKLTNRKAMIEASNRLSSMKYDDWMLTASERAKIKIESVKKIKNQSDIADFCFFLEDFEIYQIIPYLNKKNRLKAMDFFDTSEYRAKGLKYLDENEVFKLLESSEKRMPKYLQGIEEYDYLIDICAKKYNLNSDHLKKMSEVCSLEVLKHLKNGNIASLINMSDDNFNKLMFLFNKSNTTINSHECNNIFETFALHEFTNNNSEIINLYSNIISVINKEDIDAKTMVAFRNTIRKVYEDYDDGTNLEIPLEKFIESLLKRDENSKNKLHDMCDTIIDKKRKLYVDECIERYKRKGLKQCYETNAAIKSLLCNVPFEQVDFRVKNIESLTKDEIELIKNRELFESIYNFKRNPKEYPLTVEGKKNINIFNKIMDKCYSKVKETPVVIDILDNNCAGNMIYSIPETKYDFLIDVMSGINAQEFIDRVACSDEKLAKINEVLGKYKYLTFDDKFKEMNSSSKVLFSEDFVSSLILNYDLIENDLEDAMKKASQNSRKISRIISYINTAEVYSSSAKVYAPLLGRENLLLIKANPGPNSASGVSREFRVNTSVENVKKLYSRDSVPVPSYDKDIMLDNGKKLNVVVGNFTNPITLTYAERTGACTRVGGAGQTLYDFCIKKENGFHIRISDPETGEFVSRAHCIRNGNFVVINSLRHSVSEKYDDVDLVNLTRDISKKMIEETKNSENPIENVIVIPSYATDIIERKKEEFSCRFDSGLGDVGLDQKDTGVILATTGKPLRPGPVPKYKPVRDKVSEAKIATEGVERIETLDQYLGGTELEDIVLPDKKYDKCYYGEDWYVALDEDGHISYRIMNNSKRKEEAMLEMKEVLDRMNLEISNEKVERGNTR